MTEDDDDEINYDANLQMRLAEDDEINDDAKFLIYTVTDEIIMMKLMMLLIYRWDWLKRMVMLNC